MEKISPPPYKIHVLPTNNFERFVEDTQTINICQNTIHFLSGFPEIFGKQGKIRFSIKQKPICVIQETNFRVNCIIKSSNIEELNRIWWLLFYYNIIDKKNFHCCEIVLTLFLVVEGEKVYLDALLYDEQFALSVDLDFVEKLQVFIKFFEIDVEIFYKLL